MSAEGDVEREFARDGGYDEWRDGACEANREELVVSLRPRLRLAVLLEWAAPSADPSAASAIEPSSERNGLRKGSAGGARCFFMPPTGGSFCGGWSR